MGSTPHIPESNVRKAFAAMGWCVRHPVQALGRLTRGLATIHREQVALRSPLPAVSVRDLVTADTVLRLSDCHGREGNVSLQELLVISALVRQRRPRVLLEIGTFDGNTTLQMAHNSPDDAKVFTLDLPPGGVAQARLDPNDGTYINDTEKRNRKFERAAAGRKVTQCLGDSATFDFDTILAHGRPELVFIDGSHSYDYIKNDTEKVLALLATGGAVLWHDYVPAWPGVILYLDELGERLPLRRIEGTSLVYLDTASGNTASVPAPGPAYEPATAAR